MRTDLVKDLIEASAPEPLMNSIYECNEKIREKEAEIRSCRKAVTEAQEAVDLQEALLRAEVFEAVNEAGKKKFTNTEARNAEFLRRRSTHEELQRAINQLERCREDQDQSESDLRFLERKYQALLYRAKLLAAQIQQIGGAL